MTLMIQEDREATPKCRMLEVAGQMPFVVLVILLLKVWAAALVLALAY